MVIIIIILALIIIFLIMWWWRWTKEENPPRKNILFIFLAACRALACFGGCGCGLHAAGFIDVNRMTTLDSTFEDDFDSQRHILSLYITYRRELVSSYPTDKKIYIPKVKCEHLFIFSSSISSQTKKGEQRREPPQNKSIGQYYILLLDWCRKGRSGGFFWGRKKYGPHTVGSPTGKFLYASNNNACIYKKSFSGCHSDDLMKTVMWCKDDDDQVR